MTNNIELRVGVKAFIQNKNGEYLILHRNKEKYPEVEGLWEIAGGRINPGEPHKEGLAREIYEETKLKIDNCYEPKLIDAQDIFWKNKHILRVTYILKAKEGEVILDKEENDRYSWLIKEDIIQIPEKERDKYMNETFKKYFLNQK